MVIRRGAMLRPQAYGHFLENTSCAFGAALEAIGGLGENDGLPWPELLHRVVRCPAFESDKSAINVVMHLNDQHQWTREQIAGWVETLEGERGARIQFMPRSLVDLQEYWNETGPQGARFEADKTIDLLVERVRRYEAALCDIALQADNQRCSQLALEALDLSLDQVKARAELAQRSEGIAPRRCSPSTHPALNT